MLILILLAGCGGSSDSGSGTSSPIPSTGITYFIDATGGNDGNDGLTAATAWRTLSKINSSTFSPGDTLQFKRGEVWREQLDPPSSGSGAAPILFTSYGSGANPVLSGADIFSGWTLASGSIYSRTGIAAQSGVVVENGSPLTFLPWNTDVTTTFLAAGAGSYSFDYNSGTMYVWSSDGADPDTHTMEVAVRFWTMLISARSYLDFQNLTFRHAARHCIQTDSADNINISNSIITECGGEFLAVIGAHLGNGIEWAGSTTNSTLTNSILSGNFDTGASPQINSSSDLQSNITISNNTIFANGLMGVEVSMPSTIFTSSTIQNVTISGNEIYDTGLGWSGLRSGDGIAIYVLQPASQINSVTVVGNTIRNNGLNGITIGNDSGPITIQNNEIYGNSGRGISQNDGQAAPANPATGDLRVYYNLVHNNAEEGFLYNTVNGGGYTIDNNVFDRNGDGSTSHNFSIFAAQASRTIRNNIFTTDGSDASISFVSFETLPAATLGNNLYFKPGGANMIFYNDGPLVYTTVDFTSFQSLFGTLNSLGEDPLFVNAAGNDFHLQAGSNAIDGGIDVGLLTDFAGTALPQGAGVDIGAYEQ